MKLLVLSDLHLEFDVPFAVPPDVEYDVVVLAGDIHSPGRKAVKWAKQEPTFGGKPIILVPGNHEFYGCEVARELAAMKTLSEPSNVHVLDRGEATLGGVRFLGCTLWTDFQLPVKQLLGDPEIDVGRAMATGNLQLNDFRLIELLAVTKLQLHTGRLLRAEDTLAWHWTDRDWLRRSLRESFNGPTVIVTHHAPAIGSVADQYAADWLTPAFVSDLTDAFFEVPTLWIHGHTHSPFDYQRGACRVVSNPYAGTRVWMGCLRMPSSTLASSSRCAFL
jgi:predicted phosphodiesterase